MSNSRTPKPPPLQFPSDSQLYGHAPVGPSEQPDTFGERLDHDVPPLDRPPPSAMFSPRGANVPQQHTPSRAPTSSGAPLGEFPPPGSQLPHTPSRAHPPPGAVDAADYSDSPPSSSASSIFYIPAGGHRGQMSGSFDSLPRTPDSGASGAWRPVNPFASSSHRPAPAAPMGHRRQVSDSSQSLPRTPDSERLPSALNPNAPVWNPRWRHDGFASPSVSDTSDSLPHTPASGPGLLNSVAIVTPGSQPEGVNPQYGSDFNQWRGEEPRLKYRKGQVWGVNATSIFTPLFLACFEAAPTHVSTSDLSAYQASLNEGQKFRPCIVAEDFPNDAVEEFPKVFLMTSLSSTTLEEVPAAVSHWMVPISGGNVLPLGQAEYIETVPPWSKAGQLVIACAFRPTNLKSWYPSTTLDALDPQPPYTYLDPENFTKLCNFSSERARSWRKIIEERNIPEGSSWRVVLDSQAFPPLPLAGLSWKSLTQVVGERIRNYTTHANAVPFHEAEVTQAYEQLNYHKGRYELLRTSDFIHEDIRSPFEKLHASNQTSLQARIAAAEFNSHEHQAQRESYWRALEMNALEAAALHLHYETDGAPTREATPEDDPMLGVEPAPKPSLIQKILKTLSLPTKFFEAGKSTSSEEAVPPLEPRDNNAEAALMSRPIKPLPRRRRRATGSGMISNPADFAFGGPLPHDLLVTSTSEGKRTMTGEATTSLDDTGISSLDSVMEQ
ncbi:hypothetical protein C8R46DRAFT_1263101 [Mycena filopes]|nr:hypothetical protein C8R46DRAFT_1263101 [Mycena filopes]